MVIGAPGKGWVTCSKLNDSTCNQTYFLRRIWIWRGNDNSWPVCLHTAEYGSGEGHVTCSKWNDLYVIGCEIQMRHGIWWEILNVWSAAHARANLMIITTNRSTKPPQNMTYDISMGPIFFTWIQDLKSESQYIIYVMCYSRMCVDMS